MVDFSNRTEVEVWLKSVPNNRRVALAARTALRVLPAIGFASSQRRGDLVLKVLRSALVLSVAAVRPTPEIERAASAALAAFSASGAAVADACGSDAAAHTFAFCFAAPCASDSEAFTPKAAYAWAESPIAAVALAIVSAPAGAAGASGGRFSAHVDFQKEAQARVVASVEADVQMVQAESSAEAIFRKTLWAGGQIPMLLADGLEGLNAIWDWDGDAAAWEFWRHWYEGILRGAALDWDLLEQVALLPEEFWNGGPEAVAEWIAQPKEAVSKSVPVFDVAPSSALLRNRSSLTLLSHSVIEQLNDYRERVRGINAIGTDEREKTLQGIDHLVSHIQELLEIIAKADQRDLEAVDIEAESWVARFRSTLYRDTCAYLSPENTGKAVLPTGIILACTGIGSLLGMPIAGSIVGGLITGHMKPTRAADALLADPNPPAQSPGG